MAQAGVLGDAQFSMEEGKESIGAVRAGLGHRQEEDMGVS